MICNNLGPRNIQPKGFKMPDNTYVQQKNS